MEQRPRGSVMYATIKTCCNCECDLVVGVNITQNRIDKRSYMCTTCRNTQTRNSEHSSGRHKAMNENIECSLYLGVCVAEKVLSHIFENVEVMPHGNKGYDFICNKGYKIDAKSTCINYNERGTGRIMFNIRKNTTTDYFLCMVFDDRKLLMPVYIWLLPGHKFNMYQKVSASVSTIGKWDEYMIDKIDDATSCCNTWREEIAANPEG